MKKVVLIRSNPVNPDPPVEKMADTLSKQGYEVTIVGWDRYGNYDIKAEDVVLNKDCAVKKVCFGIPAIFGGGFKKNFKALFTFQIRLWKWLKENKDEYDIIHAFDFDTGFVAHNIAKKYRKNFVYHILDFYVDSHDLGEGFLRSIVKKLEFSVINFADAVIICNEKRREQIEGSNPKKLLVIHNTPKAMQPDNVSEVKIMPSDRLKIAYVGVFTVGRLLEELCETVSKREDLELHIGGFGILGDKIKAYADRYDNIYFYGKMLYHNTLSLEKQCDVMFAVYDPSIPNHKYSAPNKFYEALMLGKPIIMAKNTGFDEIFAENDIGVLIDYSQEGLNNGLDKVKCDIHKMNEGKKLYEESFSWEIMEKRIVDMYERIVG